MSRSGSSWPSRPRRSIHSSRCCCGSCRWCSWCSRSTCHSPWSSTGSPPTSGAWASSGCCCATHPRLRARRLRRRPRPPRPLSPTMAARVARVLPDSVCSAVRRRAPRPPSSRLRATPRMAATARPPGRGREARARNRVAARRLAVTRGARRDPHRPGGPALETGENPAPVGAPPERARRVASSAEASARTVAAAVEAAAATLGLRPDQVEVEVLKQPVPSTFGKIGEAAVVRVTQSTAAAEPIESTVAVDTELAGDFVEGLLDALDVDGDITTWVDVAGGHVDIEGPKLEFLVGMEGEILSALQELTRLAVLRQTQRWVRITVDVNGFKVRRREEIAAIAKGTAERVAASRQDEELEPMTAFERKIVHDVIAEIPGAQSDSIGEEPNRRVMVRPA